MKNNYKIIKIIFILCTVVIVIAFCGCNIAMGSCVYMLTPSDYKQEIKTRWEVEIPEECALEYHSNDKLQSDGVFVYVFSSETALTDFTADFSAEKDADFEAALESDLQSLKDEKPEVRLPQWDKEYLWKFKGDWLLTTSDDPNEYMRYNRHLYLIYYPDNFELYVCETIK